MSDTEEKLARSLTAESVEIIPYLPYLLQDIWELGASPKDMIHLISKYININEGTRVLDLACGKGAVGISIASEFGCKIKGIDIIPEFIEDAKKKASEYNVEALCDFIIEDINKSVEIENGYDIVIFGAVGDVLGNHEDTLRKLSNTIKSDGYILLDDAYNKSKSDDTYLTKEDWIEIIEKVGYKTIDDIFVNQNELSDILKEQMKCISNRTKELKEKYPDLSSIFDDYLENQLAECQELETDLIGVTMLLKKIDK